MDQSIAVNRTPFVLVTGFLGSGKTSLLKTILRTVDKDCQIAIVQNEFAPGKTDSVELQNQSKNFDLLEINNGSVFCACLLDSFISRLDSFLETFSPDLIFLEATGLADPVSLGQVLQAPEVQEKIYLAGIWTVIDAVNFRKSHQFIQQVRHQIQLADLIIFNKSDLRAPSEETITKIRNWNTEASIEEAIQGDFGALQRYLQNLSSGLTDQYQNNRLPVNQNSASRPDIGSCVIRTQKIIPQEKFMELWDAHKHKFLRIKGFLRVSNTEICSVQTIFDQIKIIPVDFWKGPTEIIFIGPGVEPRWILKELTS